MSDQTKTEHLHQRTKPEPALMKDRIPKRSRVSITKFNKSKRASNERSGLPPVKIKQIMILYTVNKLSTVQIGRKTNLGLTKVSEIINKYLDAYLKDPTQFEEELSPNDLKIYPTVI